MGSNIHEGSRQLHLPTSLAKTWILNENFWNKWQEANSLEEFSGRQWIYREEEPVWDNKAPKKQ